MRRVLRTIGLALLVAALGGTGILSLASLGPIARSDFTTTRDPLAAAAAPQESAEALPVVTPTPTPAPEPAGIGGNTTDLRWEVAIRTPDGARVGVVTADAVNIRSAPGLDAQIVGTAFGRHPIPIYDEVPGDPVDGNPTWYRIGPDRYISAAMVAPFIPTPPEQTFPGHWVDVNLSSFYAVAYDGGTPIYAAIITAGRDGKTPTGVFEVFQRVRRETMDSTTVGIPEDDPRYYYLEEVEYTQYFKEGGYALHENYWTPPSAFGGFGSNGCIGLLEPDAAFLWDFLDIGSTVSIHY